MIENAFFFVNVESSKEVNVIFHALLGTAFLHFSVPETKGKTEKEIREYFIR